MLSGHWQLGPQPDQHLTALALYLSLSMCVQCVMHSQEIKLIHFVAMDSCHTGTSTPLVTASEPACGHCTAHADRQRSTLCHVVWALQVFDLRSAPRMMNSVPFRPGPSLLRFHPKFSSTLLIGSQAGIFTLSDIQGTAAGPTYQVHTITSAVCMLSLWHKL